MIWIREFILLVNFIINHLPIQKDKIYKVGMRELKPGFERPVIVHRAILGSVERMFAILCEHTGGKWPFWLSPRQIAILPINDDNLVYGKAILNQLDPKHNLIDYVLSRQDCIEAAEGVYVKDLNVLVQGGR